MPKHAKPLQLALDWSNPRIQPIRDRVKLSRNTHRFIIVSLNNTQLNSGQGGLHLGSMLCLTAHQTQNICITFIQRRPNVFDVGPTLYKCYTNVLCLLRRFGFAM